MAIILCYVFSLYRKELFSSRSHFGLIRFIIQESRAKTKSFAKFSTVRFCDRSRVLFIYRTAFLQYNRN